MGQVVVGQIAASRIASISARPAAGPSRIATATARFSSITGDGTICAAACRRGRRSRAQSVAAALGASAWTAEIAAWIVYGPNVPRRSARSTSAVPSRDLLLVPERAVLILEQDQLAVGVVRAARRDSWSSIRASRPIDLRLGQQLDQQAPEPDRLGGEIVRASAMSPEEAE